MSNRGPRIRRQLLGDASMSEQFRDTQAGLDIIPLVLLRVVELPYSEPLTLGNLSRSPDAIEVIRVIDLRSQETPLHVGGLCHFVWRPNKGGAQIESVDGMSVAADGGKKYRFTFRLTYAPVGGV